MVQPRDGSTATWTDRLLDGVVVLLATWTVVYHLCVLVRLGTTWAVALEVVCLGAVSVCLRRCRDRGAELEPRATSEESPRSAPGRRTTGWALIAVVAAVVAAVGMATSAPWVLVWVPWLVAAAAGTTWAAKRLVGDPGSSAPNPPAPDPSGTRVADGVTVAVVLSWTFGLAILAMWSLRPNPDDLFYLNLAQWVAAHGTFPVRDTLFGDLTYPMSNFPPVASYDGLVGTAAHLLGVHAGTVEYVVVPPLATGLSVLALWRLLRAWEVRRVALTLSVALTFLLFDGTSSYGSPGNLFATRLWQGKVILLCVLVPLMLVHALRYVDRPTRARALWLGACGVASVGLSTTAIFLTPIVALAAMVPLVVRSRSRAVIGFATLAGYALAAGVATKLLGGRSADDFGARRQYRFDGAWIGHEIFLTNFVALVGVLAVLVGALLIPHGSARVTTGVAVLMTGLVLVPGVTRASYDLAGLGPTLWRVSWGTTVAALVGVSTTRVVAWLTRWVSRNRGARWVGADGRGRRAVVEAVGSGTVIVLLAAFGPPIWAAETGTQWRQPFHWARTYSSRSVVQRILAVTRPGDVVLAPDAVSITLAVTTTDVKSVAPRDYYMYYLRRDPSFHYRDRLALVEMVNGVEAWRPEVARRALLTLHVRVVCVSTADPRGYAVIASSGYTPLLETGYYRCLQGT